MTAKQLAAALQSVGACFAVSSAKFISPKDGSDAKPSYHIHPDCSYPHEDSIVRVSSQRQLMDWVRTARAAAKANQEDAYWLWMAYEDRWAA